MAEDRLFERSQLRAGLDPELLDEPLPTVAVAGERVGLSTVAVEGDHQLPEHALVERLRCDGALQVGNQLAVTAEGEGSVDALRPRCTALVVEPRRRRARVRLERNIRQRVAPPKCERFVECPKCLVEVVRGDSGARGPEKLGEACGVQFEVVARWRNRVHAW